MNLSVLSGRVCLCQGGSLQSLARIPVGYCTASGTMGFVKIENVGQDRVSLLYSRRSNLLQPPGVTIEHPEEKLSNPPKLQFHLARTNFTHSLPTSGGIRFFPQSRHSGDRWMRIFFMGEDCRYSKDIHTSLRGFVLLV